MKILLVLHGFAPELSGGTERTVEALAKAMVGAGHDVVIVCGSLEVGSPDRVDELRHDGLKIVRLHRDDLYFESWWKSYHPGISRTLHRIIRAERPDVVHVHHWLRLTSDIARIGRELGARTVVTAHDYFPVLARVTRRFDDDSVAPPEPARWMPGVEAEEAFAVHRRDFHDELSAAHVRLAPSLAHQQGLRACAHGDLGAMQICPPPLLDVPQRLRHAPVRGGHRLVTWGSVYADKGLETVLDAMRAAGGDWSLQVLGEVHDPAYADELKNLSAGLDVKFTGGFTAGDLTAVRADYAVLPSVCHESYGLVMDEAHALGLPVIASDLPAYREHARERSCLFVLAGDAASLTMVLLDPERLAQLEVPEPLDLQTPAAAAAELLAIYEGVDPAGAEWAPDRERERARARLLFRRSERRLWSVLNGQALVLPPDDFMAEEPAQE